MRIVISGTVGVGKSSITKELVNILKNNGKEVNVLNELTTESIYLKLYYDEPAKWGFISQLDFLMNRFHEYLLDEQSRNKNTITIYDRHFLDDLVFAELNTIKENISSFNSITYKIVFNEMLKQLEDSRPDFFFLLKATPETIETRIKGRNRSEERLVSKEYWDDLYHTYYNRPMIQNYFKENVKNLVVIDTENKTILEIVQEIMKIMEGN